MKKEKRRMGEREEILQTEATERRGGRVTVLKSGLYDALPAVVALAAHIPGKDGDAASHGSGRVLVYCCCCFEEEHASGCTGEGEAGGGGGIGNTSHCTACC
jgi:hypothetical protein